MDSRTWNKYLLIFAIGGRIVSEAFSLLGKAQAPESTSGEKITAEEGAAIVAGVMAIAMEEVTKLVESQMRGKA